MGVRSRLLWLLALLTAAGLQHPVEAAGTVPGITVEDVADYHGHPAFRITTPTATYIYDKMGAGFGSIIDPDGKDWVGFRPTGGSDGKYRGIPNAIHPEGGFHPGSSNCSTRLLAATAGNVTLESQTKDGRWGCTWEITPARATMTLTSAGHPYWLLYEGTPGGTYNEMDAFMVDSAGTRTPCTRRWERRLPEPRWIYFGTKSSRYVLFLIDHTERPPDVRDSFWSMQRNMTVFGFGRVLNSRSPRWKHLKAVPARLTIGLIRNVAPDETRKRLNALAQRTRAHKEPSP